MSLTPEDERRLSRMVEEIEPRSPRPSEGLALGPDERDEEGNEVGADPAAPSRWRPQRKWFAAAVGAAALNGLAALGIDIGAVVVDLAEQTGLEVDEESVEGVARTAIGALAGHYLWPEWRSLPREVRGIARRLLGRVSA